MRGVLLRWFVLTAAGLIASWLLDGIHVTGLFPALLAAATLGILNAFLRPLLILLTLPINILTLGLFTFLINALMLKIVSEVIPGFYVYGFWTADLGALIIGATKDSDDPAGNEQAVNEITVAADVAPLPAGFGAETFLRQQRVTHVLVPRGWDFAAGAGLAEVFANSAVVIYAVSPPP